MSYIRLLPINIFCRFYKKIVVNYKEIGFLYLFFYHLKNTKESVETRRIVILQRYISQQKIENKYVENGYSKNIVKFTIRKTIQ